MGERLKTHAQGVRDLLADIQTIVEQGWPCTNPDMPGHLVEQIASMIQPIDVETEGVKTLEIDMTLANLVVNLDTIAADMLSGPDQGEWREQS